MKKVLIIASTGGFLSQFLKGDVAVLQELGYEIHYASNFDHNVYSFDPKELTDQGVKLHAVGLHKKPWHVLANARALRQLTDIIRTEQIDLIHCHNPVGGMLGRLAGVMTRDVRPKVIYTAHGFHFFKGAPASYWIMFYPIERLLARATDLIITINREDMERAERFHLKKGGRVELIHGVGLDPDRFRPRPEARDRMRRELGIPERAFHMVTAAELNANKNQSTVLKAMADIRDKDIYYSICGRGEKEEELRDLITKLGLSGRARLLGYRTDMEMVLQSADCFVFPSRREGFGMAAVEALATGIPVIAADNRGTREYMLPHENGFVCLADDQVTFAEAIGKLKEDMGLRSSLSKGALRSAAKFKCDATMDRMREIYSKC